MIILWIFHKLLHLIFNIIVILFGLYAIFIAIIMGPIIVIAKTIWENDITIVKSDFKIWKEIIYDTYEDVILEYAWKIWMGIINDR